MEEYLGNKVIIIYILSRRLAEAAIRRKVKSDWKNGWQSHDYLSTL